MKVLYLGYHNSPLVKFLKSEGDSVFVYQDKINVDFCRDNGFDFIVSYGYRYIIKEKVINEYKNRAINLHISLLPYNRGADPNFWSWVEYTPKGVTIHRVEKGLDAGDILIQKEVEMGDDETFRTSYAKLHIEIQKLFKLLWYDIKNNRIEGRKQPEGGTYHRLSDKNTLIEGLESEWMNMKVSDFLEYIDVKNLRKSYSKTL